MAMASSFLSTLALNDIKSSILFQKVKCHIKMSISFKKCILIKHKDTFLNQKQSLKEVPGVFIYLLVCVL